MHSLRVITFKPPPPKKTNKQTNKTNTTTTKNRRARVSGIARQANTVEYTIKDSQLVTCVTVMASLGLGYVEQNLKKTNRKGRVLHTRGGWVHVRVVDGCMCAHVEEGRGVRRRGGWGSVRMRLIQVQRLQSQQAEVFPQRFVGVASREGREAEVVARSG